VEGILELRDSLRVMESLLKNIFHKGKKLWIKINILIVAFVGT
jgi:hypothetical protein